ncbi:hypothetical protein ILYODFUR_009874, partial [Ilyodon furcidens]
MAKEKNQTRGFWEDLVLTDEFPEPCTKQRTEQNEEAEDTAAGDTGEGAKDRAVKCSPTLLRMLKAAESRWTPQTRHRNKAAPSEMGLKETEAEALKTYM